MVDGLQFNTGHIAVSAQGSVFPAVSSRIGQAYACVEPMFRLSREENEKWSLAIEWGRESRKVRSFIVAQELVWAVARMGLKSPRPSVLGWVLGFRQSGR